MITRRNVVRGIAATVAAPRFASAPTHVLHITGSVSVYSFSADIADVQFEAERMLDGWLKCRPTITLIPAPGLRGNSEGPPIATEIRAQPGGGPSNSRRRMMPKRETQEPTVTMASLERQPGESEKDHLRRVERFISGEDVTSKTDLVGWTGSLPFHLNREPR